MKRTENQFRIAIDILREYKGKEPFHLYLREEFKKRRSGSSDRRFIRLLCYAYLRVKKAMPKSDPEKIMLTGIVLTEPAFDEKLIHLLKSFGKEDWIELSGMPLDQRIETLKEVINTDKIFPLIDRISRQIDRRAFIHSHISQPLTWIRVDEKHKDQAIDLLKKASLSPILIEDVPNAIGLEPSVNLEGIFGESKLNYEIQDLSSQRTMIDLAPAKGAKIWDCCAGSGGKTLALAAGSQKCSFFVSDNRLPILKNLNKRFRSAGVIDYSEAVLDLAANQSKSLVFQKSGKEEKKEIKEGGFDMIVADVPCSGSGTWGRNPEWLFRFNPKKLNDYVSLQRKLLMNALRYLKHGGELIYITCSVYEQENEQNVKWLQEEFGLSLIDTKYMEGYTEGADTMFRARLMK